LPEQRHQGVAFVVLVGGGGRAALFLRGDGAGEGGEGGLQGGHRDRRGGVGGIARHAFEDRARGFFEGMVGGVGEAKEDS
jgi:hypothetical protein